MTNDWRERIVSTTGVLRGKPRIRDTRISVSLILGYLADGYQTDAILEEFPDLTAKDIAACLEYARELAEFEVVT